MTEAATEGREAFAAALDAGDELLLARADGPLVDATVLRIDGVDLDLRAMAGDLVPGGLATIRLHDGASAWFATLIVLGVDACEGGAEVVTTRIGDALRVTSERWTERVDLVAPAVLRPEVGPDPMLRAESLNLSLTGVALRVRERPPELGTRIGVVLAGDGDGSIAFRGRVTRSSRTSHGAVLGVEIVGISRDDHRRLQRAIGRRFDPDRFAPAVRRVWAQGSAGREQMEMLMPVVHPMLKDQAREQRALVRHILRVRPDVSPAQLVGILGGRALNAARERPADRT